MQRVQLDRWVLPSFGEYVPAGHSLQPSANRMSWYFPASQSAQDLQPITPLTTLMPSQMTWEHVQVMGCSALKKVSFESLFWCFLNTHV